MIERSDCDRDEPLAHIKLDRACLGIHYKFDGCFGSRGKPEMKLGRNRFRNCNDICKLYCTESTSSLDYLTGVKTHNRRVGRRH